MNRKNLVKGSTIILSGIVLILALLVLLRVGNSQILFPFMFLALGIQQILLGLTNYKNSKVLSLFSFSSALFILSILIYIVFIG